MPALTITVKNGDIRYDWNSTASQYTTKKADRVNEYDSLLEGLAEFLYTIDPETGDASDKKVTLTYIPDKKKKKSKA